MELAVATVFVSPIVRPLITKVLAYSSGEIGLVWGVKGELEKLAQTLELIEAVLHDAEKRQLENDRLVTLWLENLKDVAYDVEDILDELQYKDLRRKVKNVSNISRLFPSKPIDFGYKISHKIKDVNEKLDEITERIEKFKFLKQLCSSGSNIVLNDKRPETSPHINDPAAVVGRKDNLSEILDLLNQKSYSVVRIIGMGGIGKTTLAKLVYAIADDNSILEDHFVLKMWVSLTRKSNTKEIFWDLLEPDFDRQSSLDAIKSRLKKRLKVGKCLIVLDDVWINHDINVEELLNDLLSLSFPGSKILMTMRSAEDIPPKTGCRYKIYQLQGLPEDDCWSLIKKTAFGHGGAKPTPNLINIRMQIASKCGGLPLAAKTLGGLLYSKNNEEEWLSILNNRVWNSPTGENNIIFILKLSYDHLSPYVKQCFSYCSIFPKGHYFDKRELIRMWMAEGFLNCPWQSNASPETVGNEYFKILLLNSFFHDERKNKWGDDTKSCRMHDLVHDLAMSIARSESRMVKVSREDGGSEVNMQSNKLRRLGLQVLHSEVSTIPSEIYKASKLHTFVSFCPENYGFKGKGVWAKKVFSLSLLRVLDLSCAGIEKLPQAIGKLKHLRYIDLSQTRIKTFPSSFCQLYNLQTLMLKGCDLKELPKDMRKLISLEYFIFTDGNSLTQMPREVSRLSKLKELSVFIVGIGKGNGIEELKDLNHLGGKLIIKNLGSETDGKQANLMGKEKIIHLQLRWDSKSCDDSNRISKDTVVINDLQPHPNLKGLKIFCFAGSIFPTWMSTSIHLPNLVHITMQDCGKCEYLPALGRLQSLRYLFMQRMGAIKQIGTEFYQSNEEASFPCLVDLHIISFSNLEEWLRSQRSSKSSFSCLEKLVIRDCSKLSTTPTRFPSLKTLDFSIKLESCPNLKSLPLKLLRGANNVL